jgi:predicted DCC family thiol-disulfide oxidoreductase YuxK
MRPALGVRLASRANARTAALLRICAALAGFLVWLEEAPVMLRLTEPGILRVPYPGLPQVPAVLFQLAIASWLMALIGLAIGFQPRLAAGTLAAVLGFTLLADQQLYSNHLYLLLLVVILIRLSDAGAALSVGHAQRRDMVPGWPLGLVRAQVSIIYGFAALAKLNPAYLSGTVLGAYLRDTGPIPVPHDWRGFQLLFGLSILSVLAEAFLAVALWLPYWRRTALVVGLALHVGIAVWLEPTLQLITFGFLMLPLYLAFIDPRPRALAVVWDDQCSFCQQWITWANRLDWLHAIRLVPVTDAAAREPLGVSEEDALNALRVVDDAEHASGYDAVVRIAEVLPISFLWAPLLRLPLVSTLGRRTYRGVAARRRCGLRPDGPHVHEAAETGPIDLAV